MFNRSAIIVGLEIGTSKVCAIVGEYHADGALSIIGVGQAKSRGVRKGEIIDNNIASEDIRSAIVEAEQMADVEIRSVFLGVTGGHLRGFNNHGVYGVVSADREITADDLQDALKNAKTVNLPADHHIIHVIRQHFTVDGQPGIPNPVGMLASKLEVDVHIVHGNLNRLQNPIRTVKGLQLDVENIAFTGIASSMAILTNEQKEIGALVIDLGAGATEYVVTVNGVVKHTGILAVGGDHVSNDLAFGLKVSMSRAEQLKIDHGAALPSEGSKGETLTISNEIGLPPKTINLDHLRRIMHLRIEELFQLIHEELQEAELMDYLRAGVVLCGGGARIPEIHALAGQVFQLPVSAGKTQSISGLKSALEQPEFAAAIGLVKFGSFQIQKRKDRAMVVRGWKSTLGQWFRRA